MFKLIYIGIIMVFTMQSVHAKQFFSIATLPGAEPFSASMTKQLIRRLQQSNKAHQPRTQHIDADGRPIYTNRLLLEASPYLLQHAHNPVNWYPWGDDAFAEAKRLNRPLLVSIGYSTCHWCHVMEEESYDNPQIAEYVNRHYIAIKVDRESRPDIDAIYMRAVQSMTGHGGWPLNVFLLPDKQAFYGGTYFPPQDIPGRPGILTVLQSITNAYRLNFKEIHEFAKQLTTVIQQDVATKTNTDQGKLSRDPVLKAIEVFQNNIDPLWGGVGKGIKFPSSTPIQLLLQEVRKTSNPQLLSLVKLTLDKMAAGGIYDHLGGGFHRYSTDQQWLVPHFEKMLYDNALLVMDYLAAWQLTKATKYRRIVEQTLDYVRREMTAPEGGFYSATDADSLNDQGEMQEGWFFTWSREEISTYLDKPHADIIAAWFGMTERGQLDGRNVFHTSSSEVDFAAQHGLQLNQLQRLLTEAKTTLLLQRNKRTPPLRDDKIITAWNGLMIAAFAKAGFALNRPDYLQTSRQAANFILNSMLVDGRLQRIHLNGITQETAFLNDYAFFIHALLVLYQADTNPRWIQQAVLLQQMQDKFYQDKIDGVYFITAHDSEKLLYRDKPDDDGVMPSGNSSSALNLLYLFKLTTDESYHSAAIRLMQSMRPVFNKTPLTMTDMLTTLDLELSDGKEVVLVLVDKAENNPAMLDVVRGTYIPEHVLVVVKAGAHLVLNAKTSTLIKGKRSMRGESTAFVCKNKTCNLPTIDANLFQQQLLSAGHN